MAEVRALWRHPIKGHGREAVTSVTLNEGQTIPWDRRWAVAHAGAQTDGKAWAPCVNYSRGSKVPALMAITAVSDEAAGTVTLSHPDRPDLTFDPDHETERFLDWVRPLMPENRAQSAMIHRVPSRGMTDTDYPSISLINLASHADLEARMGTDISPLRWRCNIHFDGFSPWEELSWENRTLRIGSAEMTVCEPIERCLATTANPATGERDLDTLGTLNSDFGHQDFGIYAVVSRAGRIQVGDEVTLL
ncbi:MOSC domain-containing protein [Roseovarius faecimaris]|uniref:MOSC domain-containing protein n=1 Tax=Roseovarius faecimaris TaxID=2494550 RepID=A0A6I6IMV1_9RHOB|nr:MOSC domain-containing protein [Roseovarius faecimaris]QGX97123.1 MOSC domain-containing protein [Roseovarius faecimaris]